MCPTESAIIRRTPAPTATDRYCLNESWKTIEQRLVQMWDTYCVFYLLKYSTMFATVFFQDGVKGMMGRRSGRPAQRVTETSRRRVVVAASLRRLLRQHIRHHLNSSAGSMDRIGLPSPLLSLSNCPDTRFQQEKNAWRRKGLLQSRPTHWLHANEETEHERM